MKNLWLVFGALSLMLSSAQASAEEDAKKKAAVSVSDAGGSSDSDDSGSDKIELSLGPRFGSDVHQRLGAGARAGFGLSGGFYLGAMFDYYFGSTEARELNNASGEVTKSSWTFMIEPGFDVIVIDDILIRAFVGLGTTSVRIESTLFDTDVTDRNFTAEVGALMHYDLGFVFVGPEVRGMFGDGNEIVGGVHVGTEF